MLNGQDELGTATGPSRQTRCGGITEVRDMASPKRVARSFEGRSAALKATRAATLADVRRLDLIERFNLAVHKSPDTGLWVVTCSRESRVDISPAKTLRQALDDFANTTWPVK